MQFQVTVEKSNNGKIVAEWKTRKDTESIEKYDNDMGDGFQYVGVNGPATNEAEIEAAINTYCDLRTSKAGNDVVLPQWSRINFLVESARKQFVK